MHQKRRQDCQVAAANDVSLTAPDEARTVRLCKRDARLREIERLYWLCNIAGFHRLRSFAVLLILS
jgi:hypothetical protein